MGEEMERIRGVNLCTDVGRRQRIYRHPIHFSASYARMDARSGKARTQARLLLLMPRFVGYHVLASP